MITSIGMLTVASMHLKASKQQVAGQWQSDCPPGSSACGYSADWGSTAATSALLPLSTTPQQVHDLQKERHSIRTAAM